MPSLTPRIIGALVLIGLVVLMLTLGPAACRKWQSERAQSRVGNAQAGAAQDSAKDAIGTVARAGEETAASEQMTRDNERDIRAAEGAGDRVSMDVHAAGLRALCQRKAYADAPRCAPFKEGRPDESRR